MKFEITYLLLNIQYIAANISYNHRLYYLNIFSNIYIQILYIFLIIEFKDIKHDIFEEMIFSWKIKKSKYFYFDSRGANRIRTGDDGVADRGLTAWLSRHKAPQVGLEPTTSWLTVMRSTDWAIEEYYKNIATCMLNRMIKHFIK